MDIMQVASKAVAEIHQAWLSSANESRKKLNQFNRLDFGS
jgi:hypothetical protein